MTARITKLSLAIFASSAILGCGKGGVTSIPLMGGGSVTLARTFKAGEEQKYKMDMTMNQQMGSGDQKAGQMKMTITADMDQKTTSVAPDGKTADVLVKTSNMAFKTEPEMGLGNMLPKEMTTNMKIDSRNQVSAATVSGVQGAMAGQLDQMGLGSNPMGFGASLPDHPVKVGESWDVPLPKMPMLETTGSLKATLVGEKTVDGTPSWEIKITGSLPIKMNLAQSKAPAAGTSTGTMDMDFDVFLEKGTCALVSSKGTNKTKMSIDAGPKGKMDTSMDMSVSITKAGS